MCNLDKYIYKYTEKVRLDVSDASLLYLAAKSIYDLSSCIKKVNTKIFDKSLFSATKVFWREGKVEFKRDGITFCCEAPQPVVLGL